jgi:hypothetical protein
MDLDDADTKKRLRKLGTSRLADALCTLAGRNEDAADYVMRLVSTPLESKHRLRRRLDEVAESQYFVDYHAAYSFATDLEGLIEDIRMGASSPEEGVELLSTFFEMDQSILERCDDSDGAVGEVFHCDAGDAFVRFAKKVQDKNSLLERVLELYMASDYGVRSVLIERASEFLPKKSRRELVRKLWAHVEEAGEERHRSQQALIGLESLAKQLKDPALFEHARMYGRPEPTAACCLDIAEAYAQCHQDDEALAWVTRIPEQEDQWRQSKQDGLLFTLWTRKGDKKKAEEVAWRIYRRHRSKETFDQLLNVSAKGTRKTILAGQVKEILESGRFSSTDASFLVAMNLTAEAAAYLIQNAAKLDGYDYWSLTPLAEHMEKKKQFLAASAVYRALLNSILARAQSKAYHHAAKYLRKLDAMATVLTTWDPLVPHDAYKAGIVRDHRRKWRFWDEYGQRPE